MSAAVDRLSVPPARKVAMTALVSFAGALGVAVATLCTSWVGGIVSRAELNAAVSEMATKAAVEETQKQTAKSLAEIAAGIKTEELARRSDREMLVVEMRRRVGLQALVSVTSDPRRKASGERIAAVVRARFDDLVQHGEHPTMAAEKALEAALLQGTQR